MVNAQYAIHAAERGPGKETIPPRSVWIAFFKRRVEE
jgi:hypothetical protein